MNTFAKPLNRTPDERRYILMGSCARHGTLRHLSHEPAVPSPARWLWAYWVSLFPLGSLWPSRIFAILQPWSTVSVWAGSRHLQDGAVSALTLAAIAAAHWGPWWSVALAVAALLSVKEAAGLVLPAVAVAGIRGDGAGWLADGVAPALVGIAAGMALWTLGGLVVFRGQWFRLLRDSTRGHKTDYWKQHQNAPDHVTLAMLGILCPAILALPFGGWELSVAMMLFVGLTFGPVRNVRLLGAIEGLAWFSLVSHCAWVWWPIAALPQLLTMLCLSSPGTGWKDERGTVDLVPSAIIEAMK